MSESTGITKEQYEKQLTAPLLSEEALMLLDPRSVRIDQAFYEHGFDRLTFTINNLQYSIPACVPTLPTLYFVGFNRPAASEIFAEFQTSSILSLSANHKLEKIARTYLRKKIWEMCYGVFEPRTTREALNYLGFSDEAQTNVLKLNYPLHGRPVEFMLRHVILNKECVGEWVLRYFARRLRLLTHLDYEIRRRGYEKEVRNNDNHYVQPVPVVDLGFLAEEIENKYMDSKYAYEDGIPNDIPLALITDIPSMLQTQTM